jgi:hypothetical protein
VHTFRLISLVKLQGRFLQFVAQRQGEITLAEIDKPVRMIRQIITYSAQANGA